MEDQVDENRPTRSESSYDIRPGRVADSGGDLCCESEPASNNAKEIRINSLDYGYTVKIGCQNFAVETSEKLIKNLTAYLNDPNGTERKWMTDKKLL